MKNVSWLCGLSVTAVLSGWWLAGHMGSGGSEDGVPAAWRRQPLNNAYCAVPNGKEMLMPPAPPDDPFGASMYPNLQRAKVTMLPVAAISAQLVRVAASPAAGGAVARSQAGSEEREPALDLEVVTTLLQEYKRATGAMPPGQLNDEIVRHLQGRNVRGIAVLPKNHPMINADGELMDRWGTPYFFHAESAHVMTVRSAGPDKKLWNADDVLSDNDVMKMPQGSLVALPGE